MILVTGHTGFVGKTLVASLKKSNKEFHTLGRSSDSHIKCDLSKEDPLLDNTNYDQIIHVAGLAHVSSKKYADRFYELNHQGTVRLLNSLSKQGNPPKQFVFISTVAVYGENPKTELCIPPYPQEKDMEVLDLTAYGRSKHMAEQEVLNWANASGTEALILRLPLIVGENAPGNLGAMEKAIQKGYYFRIGSGKARRSFVLLKDLVSYLSNLNGDESGVYNFISGNKSYAEFEQEFGDKYNRKIMSIPSFVANLAAKMGDLIPGFPINSYRLKKLEESLVFENTLFRGS